MKLATQQLRTIYATNVWIIQNGKRRKWANTIYTVTTGNVRDVREQLAPALASLSKQSGAKFQLITQKVADAEVEIL